MDKKKNMSRRFLPLLFVFSIVFYLPICFSSKPSLCSPHQSNALLQFKKSFSTMDEDFLKSRPHIALLYKECGDQISKTETWKEGSDCCSWLGVTCHHSTGHVIGLDVSCSKLYGRLHSNSTLFLLNHLRKINLAWNNFGGSQISFRFGHLSKLSSLNLSNCFFNGYVPLEIFSLSDLSSLDLSALRLIQYDSKPTLNQQSFDRLCQNLLKLRVLALDYANLSSVKSSSLLNLPRSLISLRLENTGLQGKFPADILKFPFLKKLNLRSNGPFTGHLPMSNWSSSLTFLDLSDCGLTPIMPRAISNLMNLTHLFLGQYSSKNYGYSSRFPSWLYNLTKLSVLSIVGVQLDGQLSSRICDLVNLSELYLDNNILSGSIPPCLFSMPSLLTLSLSNNILGGLLTNLDNQSHHVHGSGNNSNLKRILIAGNQLEGPLPEFLAHFSSLEVLSVGQNQLNGTFPVWLAALPELQVLILKSNRFESSILTFGTKLPFQKLRILDISQNGFHGPLDVFERLTSMMTNPQKNTSHGEKGKAEYYKGVTWKKQVLQLDTALDLSSNQFALPIPIAIGKLDLLKVLNLSNNLLSGQIPSSLGNMTQLVSLDLSSNLLVGEIPTELTRLEFLRTLNLSYNRLVGPIPLGNRFNGFDSTSYLGNSGLCTLPLSEKFGEDEAMQPLGDEGEGKHGERRQVSILVKVGFATAAGLIVLLIGLLMFSTGRPRWLVNMFNRRRGYVRSNRIVV